MHLCAWLPAWTSGNMAGTAAARERAAAFPVSFWIAYCAFAVGKPLFTQFAPKLLAMCTTFTFVNPIACSASYAGLAFGHLSHGQQPQYNTIGCPCFNASTLFRSSANPSAVDPGPA